MNTLRFGAILAMTAALSFGCSDDGDKDSTGAAGSGNNGAAGEGSGEGGASANAEPLELVGEYVDNFDGEQSITSSAWNGAAIVEYDNDANVVYTRNAEDAAYNPNKFGKTVYTEPTRAGEFYFCQLEFDSDTLADAKASTKTADDSDPDNAGCGDFSWSKATPK